MQAVVNHLYLTVPIETIRQAAEQSRLPMLNEIPGFREFDLVKATDDHLIALLFWEDLESADHGASVIGPTWFAQNVVPFLKREQERSLGEVVLQYHL